MDIPSDIQVALWGLATILISGLTALVEKIRRDLAENTKATNEAKQAAVGSKRAAENSQEAVEGMQQATFDRLDYDRLRRIEAAVLTFEECQPCREKILTITERRRIYPPEAK